MVHERNIAWVLNVVFTRVLLASINQKTHCQRIKTNLALKHNMAWWIYTCQENSCLSGQSLIIGEVCSPIIYWMCLSFNKFNQIIKKCCCEHWLHKECHYLPKVDQNIILSMSSTYSALELLLEITMELGTRRTVHSLLE